jgi:cytochrome P450
MAIPVHSLELPKIPFMGGQTREERQDFLRTTAQGHWLAKNDIGFSVLTYDSVLGILRDKRWHSATGLVAQIRGVTDEQFLTRRRTSILNAEGEVHVRLRRLVAPAFSPRSADRLRPFMQEVINYLVDPLTQKGSAEFVADVCEPYPIPIICELLGAPKEN